MPEFCRNCEIIGHSVSRCNKDYSRGQGTPRAPKEQGWTKVTTGPVSGEQVLDREMSTEKVEVSNKFAGLSIEGVSVEEPSNLFPGKVDVMGTLGAPLKSILKQAAQFQQEVNDNVAAGKGTEVGQLAIPDAAETGLEGSLEDIAKEGYKTTKNVEAIAQVDMGCHPKTRKHNLKHGP